MKCPYVVDDSPKATASIYKCRITELQCITPEQYENCLHYKTAWKEEVTVKEG